MTQEFYPKNLKLHILLTMQLQIYYDLHSFLASAVLGNKHQPSSLRLREGEKEEREKK